jgi:hypothetical protein
MGSGAVRPVASRRRFRRAAGPGSGGPHQRTGRRRQWLDGSVAGAATAGCGRLRAGRHPAGRLRARCRRAGRLRAGYRRTGYRRAGCFPARCFRAGCQRAGGFRARHQPARGFRGGRCHRRRYAGCAHRWRQTAGRHSRRRSDRWSRDGHRPGSGPASGHSRTDGLAHRHPGRRNTATVRRWRNDRWTSRRRSNRRGATGTVRPGIAGAGTGARRRRTDERDQWFQRLGPGGTGGRRGALRCGRLADADGAGRPAGCVCPQWTSGARPSGPARLALPGTSVVQFR